MIRLDVVTLLGLASFATGCATAGSTTASSAPSHAAVACASLPATLADGASLDAPFEVLAARPVHETVGRQRTGATRGAEIALAATPGLDANAVERALACRADAARASGSTTDPLAVEGTEVSVRASSGRVHVRIVADDRAAGAEVWSRVRALDL